MLLINLYNEHEYAYLHIILGACFRHETKAGSGLCNKLVYYRICYADNAPSAINQNSTGHKRNSLNIRQSQNTWESCFQCENNESSVLR